MANVLDDVQGFLATAFPGETVRAGYLPDTPDRVVALVEQPGDEPIGTLGQVAGKINVDIPVLLVSCRAASRDYEASRNLAESMYQAIHGVTSQTLNGTRYLTIEALQPPYNLGVDEQHRFNVGFSIRCWKEKSV